MKYGIWFAVLVIVAFPLILRAQSEPEPSVVFLGYDEFAGVVFVVFADGEVQFFELPRPAETHAPFKRRAVGRCITVPNLLLDCDGDHFPESTTPESVCVTGPESKIVIFPCIYTPGSCVVQISWYKDSNGDHWIPADQAARTSSGVLITGHGACNR